MNGELGSFCSTRQKYRRLVEGCREGISRRGYKGAASRNEPLKVSGDGLRMIDDRVCPYGGFRGILFADPSTLFTTHQSSETRESTRPPCAPPPWPESPLRRR